MPTAAKNTFRSYAAARTVFGRHRPPRNSRYASASATPVRATNSPDRCEQTTLESPACTAGSPHHRRLDPSRMAEMRRKITGITCM